MFQVVNLPPQINLTRKPMTFKFWYVSVGTLCETKCVGKREKRQVLTFVELYVHRNSKDNEMFITTYQISDKKFSFFFFLQFHRAYFILI